MNATIPDRLLVRQDDIRRIEALAADLPDEAQVRLRLDDGSQLEGTVSTRPVLQVFRHADGEEGFNAVLRLDDRVHPERPHFVWLDRVRDVFHLGSS